MTRFTILRMLGGSVWSAVGWYGYWNSTTAAGHAKANILVAQMFLQIVFGGWDVVQLLA